MGQKGITPPKNCPSCRAWIKDQSDEAVRCQACSNTFRIPARYKISHHKRIGPYAVPAECRSCERGARPPKSIDSRTNSRQIDKQRRTSSNLPSGREVVAYPLTSAHKLYEALMEIALNEVLRRMKIADVRLTTILEHLAKHNYHKPQLGTDLGKDAWALLVAALEEWTRPTAVVPPWRQQLRWGARRPGPSNFCAAQPWRYRRRRRRGLLAGDALLIAGEFALAPTPCRATSSAATGAFCLSEI